MGDDAEMSVRPSTEHRGSSRQFPAHEHLPTQSCSLLINSPQIGPRVSSVQVPAQALACRVHPPEPATWTLGLTLLQSTAQKGLWLARLNLEGIKAALRPRVVESLCGRMALPGQDLGCVCPSPAFWSSGRIEKTPLGRGSLGSSPEERLKPGARLRWLQEKLRPREFWG